MQPLRDRLCVEVLHIAMHIGHASLTMGDVPLLILTIINTNRYITFQNLCSLTNDML